ncbi:MAG: alpha/beta fold hydrolase [Desulfurellaceae bacterium]|nr:alpha/beta fold hydrolase [Desulfurellaceae bacterium]
MTPTRHFIRLGRLSVHYLAWGQLGRPPLILLHGGAAHAHWWDHIAPVLSHRYRVLAPDLRGHGDTDWAGPGAYEIDDYVADLHGLITALDPDRPVLLGHSLGGFIALAYTLTRTPRPRALIVVEQPFHAPGAGATRPELPGRRRVAEAVSPAADRQPPPARAVPGDCQAQRPSRAGRAAQAEERPGGTA